MIYAPVLIGTMDRFEHFKRCIESLDKNLYAEYTEVFVSIDFPLKESSREGNKKIVEYVRNKTFKFKELHLYIQENNLGAKGNYKFLGEKVCERFDWYISLEDDLEVAPNFLEYMDKALYFGMNDPKIFCVCGYRDNFIMPHRTSGTAFLLHGSYGGAGYYIEKLKKRAEVVNKSWLDEIILDRKKMFKIFCGHRQTFYYLLNGYIINRKDVFFHNNGKLGCIDIIANIYMVLNDLYAVVPAKSKIRNWGYDGSGENCGVRYSMSAEFQELDDEKTFQLELEESKINKIIRKRWSKYSMENSKDIWYGLMYYFYLCIMHKIKI